jgi:hypothetical protein
LFDHLEGGDSLDHFFEGFPSVRREQVMAVLEDMEDLAVVQSTRSEPTIAHEEIVAMLKEAWNADIPCEPQRWKSARKQRLGDVIREALAKK